MFSRHQELRKEAAYFQQLLLWFAFVLSAVFLIRYWPLLVSGQANFAEDFHVYWQAVQTSLPPGAAPASPYHAQGDAAYFSGAPQSYHPYLNPPFFLFLLWPMHLLPYDMQLIVWFGAQLLLFAAALNMPRVRILWPQWASRHGYLLKTLLLALPFFLNTLLAGQIGLLLAALFLIGVGLLKEKPFRAGLIFSLLSIKPQMLPVLGIYLIATRQFKTLAGLLLGLGLWIGLATAVWGGDVWGDYARALRLHSEMLQLPEIPGPFQAQLISVYGGLRMVGMGASAAMFCQGVMGLIALMVLARHAYQRPQHPLTIALMLTTIFLTSFYVLQYDAVILVAAILCLIGTKKRFPPFLVRIAIILTLASGLIAPSLQMAGIPFGMLAVVFLWLSCLVLSRSAAY